MSVPCRRQEVLELCCFSRSCSGSCRCAARLQNERVGGAVNGPLPLLLVLLALPELLLCHALPLRCALAGARALTVRCVQRALRGRGGHSPRIAPRSRVKDGGLERYKMNVRSERLPSRLLNSTNHRLKPDNSPHQQLREPSPESPATLTSSHPEHPQVSSTMTQALTDDFQYAPPPKLANPGPLGEYRGTPLARQWCC